MSEVNLNHIRYVLKQTYGYPVLSEYYHLRRSELRNLTQDEKDFCLKQKYLHRNRRGLFSLSPEGFEFINNKMETTDAYTEEIAALNFRNSVHILGERWMAYLAGEFRSGAHCNYFRNLVEVGLLKRVGANVKGKKGFALTELGESELTKIGVKLPPSEPRNGMKYPEKKIRHKIKIGNI